MLLDCKKLEQIRMKQRLYHLIFENNVLVNVVVRSIDFFLDNWCKY